MDKRYIKLGIYAVIGTVIAYGVLSAFNWAFASAYDQEPVISPVVRNTDSMQDYVLNRMKEAGISPYEAYMVINCESRWNPEAMLVNKDMSVDRGIWQISNKYHKEVSNSDAFDYKKATEHAIRIYKKSGWREWTCGKINGL